jgi:hypothetical protein
MALNKIIVLAEARFDELVVCAEAKEILDMTKYFTYAPAQPSCRTPVDSAPWGNPGGRK